MKRLVISGYGKMGKEIERLAILKNWQIVARIDNKMQWEEYSEIIKSADAIIDFSSPEVVLDNIKNAFEKNIPIIIGTTGWNSELENVKILCEKGNHSLVYGSNFSIGVNIFFKINSQLAELMNKHSSYNVIIEEIHHTKKLDSPSGTAISLANQIIEKLDRKSTVINESSTDSEKLEIISKRIGDVPGIHKIVYNSSIDEIEIMHTAKSRQGFAEGALWAAEWIQSKEGFYNFSDILFNKL
ncbi:MAG: 4-hydroxy-tetrahydrodipicolinate reductase [Bacteroidetes bacterium CG2_30_33_31]|nr:MAG: 4-hydroxy-tetrahydrodipicolinate reductase [Bacteroidetes bacterium CG2_30_33_31]